jgi:methyl-accepting chemotaxis protein
MFGKLKLGAKIAGGFVGILAVTVAALGVVMAQVSEEAQSSAHLANQVAPQVALASDLERAISAAMLEMKRFEYTFDPQALQRARAAVEKGQATLVKAREHANRYPDLREFRAAVDREEQFFGAYSELVAKTVTNAQGLGADRAALNTQAGAFMAAAEKFREARPESLEIREVQLAATQARLAVWKAQAERDPQAMEAALSSLDEVSALLLKAKAANHGEDLQRLVTQMQEAAVDYRAQAKRLAASWVENDELGRQRISAGTTVLDASRAVAVAGVESTTREAGDTAAAMKGVQTVVAVGLLVALLVGGLLAFFVTRTITRPIERIIEGLTRAGDQVASASGQVASSSQQMAAGASQQASNLEQISSTLEEVTSMTRQNAESARRANGQAKSAADAASRGALSVDRMSEAMARIKDSATETAKIVKTIDEIAFQTNLLALNAAVEAARAGDAGKGFAVVAEEVRTLAQRSAEAAKNTAELIEESQRNAESGGTVSAEVNGILREIVTSAGAVTSLVSDVASASEQQATGVAQVNTAVSQMDHVTQSNAANAEQSASASEELSAQAVELNQMVEQLVHLVRGQNTGSPGGPVARPRKSSPTGPKAPLRPPKAKAARPARPPVPARRPQPTASLASAPGPAPGPAPGSAEPGFEALPSAPLDPKQVIPLDDAELAQF